MNSITLRFEIKHVCFFIKQIVIQNPKFVIDEFQITDIHQGQFGNSWFMASVAAIIHNKDIFNIVVPSNQLDFDAKDFAGFQLYQFLDIDLNYFFNSRMFSFQVFLALNI